VPAALVGVPPRARDLDTEADVVAEAVAVGDVPEVPPDLRLRRERPGPAGVLREGEGVHVRADVARAPWIGVVTPGATDVVGLLEHDEVVAAIPFQLDCHAKTGETGTDDDRVELHAVLSYCE
jgi:hypothetical protein